MGSAKRLRKLYEKPLKLWDKPRIEEESKLLEEYGLRNMRELWRIKTILRKIRRDARSLLSKAGAGAELGEKQLVTRVRKFLVKGEATLDSVLALSTKDILERRLQTVVCRRGLANSMRQARQFITHGHIQINGQKITAPSYLVSFDEEQQVGWYGKPIELTEKIEKAEEKAKDKETETVEMPAETKPAEAEKIEALPVAASA